MSDFVIQRSLGIKIFGQEQFDYTVNGQVGCGYDIAVFKTVLLRTHGVENGLLAYTDVVSKQSKKIDELGKALAIISKVGALFQPKDKTSTTKTDDALYEAQDIMKKYGVSTQYMSGNKMKKENVDRNKTLVQNSIDLENTNLQQNVVILQNLIDERDASVKLASTLQQKVASTMDSGIRNIR